MIKATGKVVFLALNLVFAIYMSKLVCCFTFLESKADGNFMRCVLD